MPKVSLLELSQQDRKYLEALVRTRTTQAQTVNRAKILLLKAEGLSIDAIARKLDLNRNSVMLCLRKYKEGGVENALTDAPGRGRNPEITEEEKAWIIHIACQKPAEYGCDAEVWTYSKLTAHIRETAEAAGYTRLSTISRSKIQVILENAKIKLYKGQQKCQDRNPKAGMQEVLVVHKQIALPTEGTDGKGRFLLLAGIDLQTGKTMPFVSDTCKGSDFIHFLEAIDSQYPKGEKIRLILDRHSANTSRETKAYLTAKDGRFEFAFTAGNGPWMNLAEGFFGKMTRQMLRGIHITSQEELSEHIYKSFEELNESSLNCT